MRVGLVKKRKKNKPALTPGTEQRMRLPRQLSDSVHRARYPSKRETMRSATKSFARVERFAATFVAKKSYLKIPTTTFAELLIASTRTAANAFSGHMRPKTTGKYGGK